LLLHPSLVVAVLVQQLLDGQAGGLFVRVDVRLPAGKQCVLDGVPFLLGSFGAVRPPTEVVNLAADLLGEVAGRVDGERVGLLPFGE